jgi:hypothetical protein
VNNPVTINRLLRQLRQSLNKATYLQFTATPFANILQYKNDEPSVKFNLKSGGKDYFFDLAEDLFRRCLAGCGRLAGAARVGVVRLDWRETGRGTAAGCD